jgi:hypothetical protein
MSLLTLKGRIISFVEDAHANGYAVISSMLMETEDGQRVTVAKKMAVRSDILLSLQSIVAADAQCELFIEKTRWNWMATPQHIFGLKSEHIAQFDSKKLGVKEALMCPGFLLLLSCPIGLLSYSNGHGFFFATILVMVIAMILVPPFTAGILMSLVTLMGRLLTKLDRRTVFYGDLEEVKRLKALEPATL